MEPSTDQAGPSGAWEAPYLPDAAGYWTVPIAGQQRLARDTYRLDIDLPPLARRIVPGQFIMLRLAGANDPLLGRAFALYDVASTGDGESPSHVSIVYQVKGKLTRRLAHAAPGQTIALWGPLGNGFPIPDDPGTVVLVAGGIGFTPFLALARELLHHQHYGMNPPRHQAARRVVFCYGARSQAFLVGVDTFRQLGVDLHVATDDGSAGYHGRVTDLLREILQSADVPVDLIVTCGPDAMMAIVAQIAERAGLPCQVSLETPMACGIGACFSCVAKVRQADGTWDYKRTCVEGPVFDARRIVWNGE